MREDYIEQNNMIFELSKSHGLQTNKDLKDKIKSKNNQHFMNKRVPEVMGEQAVMSDNFHIGNINQPTSRTMNQNV